MTKSDDEAFALSTLADAIENQVRDGNPSEARATLDRLVGQGHERGDAIHMMAEVLAVEVRALLEMERPFDMAWYVAALQRLPELPAA